MRKPPSGGCCGPLGECGRGERPPGGRASPASTGLWAVVVRAGAMGFVRSKLPAMQVGPPLLTVLIPLSHLPIHTHTQTHTRTHTHTQTHTRAHPPGPEGAEGRGGGRHPGHCHGGWVWVWVWGRGFATRRAASTKSRGWLTGAFCARGANHRHRWWRPPSLSPLTSTPSRPVPPPPTHTNTTTNTHLHV
jgi:hypothetical protein